ncbi:unnamed protein product [Adineta steineri]|uniref:Peptidase S1 domain-containing protein n=1 Tax=Adineta steineri TaxID=433720 RepID=A0A814ZPH8_9BILA|nr:unnamed protein product [Adineta steineri]CAF1246777.1 unnamed protein product [Adineta steineri]
MLTLGITIVFLTFASMINGEVKTYVDNGKLCTAWQYATGAAVVFDNSQCSSSIQHELAMSNNMIILRFCCTYRGTTNPVVNPVPNGCGRQAVTPIRTRIVGGQEAVPHSWPWLVSIQNRRGHFCGGTLIDAYHVLTAAHCLQDGPESVSDLRVVAGLHSRSRPDPARVQTKQVAGFINHNDYDHDTSENDIAIIRLASPVTLNSYVNIACLSAKDPAVNENVIVAGWGTTTYEGSSPDALRQAGILVMDVCRYTYGNYDTNKQLCAGNYQYTKDSCQGDSGGPLVSEVNGQWILSGVVSYGDECAKVNKPGIYARVSYYLPWIRRVISNLSG